MFEIHGCDPDAVRRSVWRFSDITIGWSCCLPGLPTAGWVEKQTTAASGKERSALRASLLRLALGCLIGLVGA